MTMGLPRLICEVVEHTLCWMNPVNGLRAMRLRPKCVKNVTRKRSQKKAFFEAKFEFKNTVFFLSFVYISAKAPMERFVPSRLLDHSARAPGMESTDQDGSNYDPNVQQNSTYQKTSI